MWPRLKLHSHKLCLRSNTETLHSFTLCTHQAEHKPLAIVDGIGLPVKVQATSTLFWRQARWIQSDVIQGMELLCSCHTSPSPIELSWSTSATLDAEAEYCEKPQCRGKSFQSPFKTKTFFLDWTRLGQNLPLVKWVAHQLISTPPQYTTLCQNL